MQYLYPSEKIYVALSQIPKAGRGVFAKKTILKNEIIEVCPVIFIPESDMIHLKKTILRNYYFMWGERMNTVAIGLGLASLYNHSYDQANAIYQKNFETNTITYLAHKDIQKDAEILVNYNFGNPEDLTLLWIDDISNS